MTIYHSLTLLLTMGLVATYPVMADSIAPAPTMTAMKIATITKMYQQDIDNEGMDNPTVLQQYANTELQAAMQAERDYFDQTQMSCHVGYDVLWNSQDPDYEQDKQFAVTEQGLVQVSLAKGSQIYYELSCSDSDGKADCQVADVILDNDGRSLRKHLLETCR
ncbi:hypothetical protein [Psychrobacter aquaticus]|uniref:Uncharacterized protein n=1 Tax=Psychrobacter aquaticus CMS 56 TaxID=1354303 RepID=U4T1K2_9GAMM|nr:hypothetical protein [Psychrobacter aquaticus]ERL54622.1 hypothetical protein M917_2770 [Psychrobacter aquaticus CMS 56]